MARKGSQAHAVASADDESAVDAVVLTDGQGRRQSQSQSQSRRRRRRRIATVYDAVAGHVWPKQATRDETAHGGHGRRHRGGIVKHPTRSIPMAPDEVLFRRNDAPQRYQEHDIYNADERDMSRAALPDSDLLKAVHRHASGYYGALRARRRATDVDERSMDETALLAFGILLEEAGREVLGRRGDLVFTERADDDDRDEVARGREAEPGDGLGEAGTAWEVAKSGPKRRKVVKDEDGDDDGEG